MNKEKAREVAKLVLGVEVLRDLLKEVREAQREHGTNGVVTLTLPAAWMTDIATLALRDIEKAESEIDKL